MDEQPAPEEGAELALDEAGQPDPVGARGGRGEESLQVLPDHSVQDRVGGSARDVGSHGARPSGFRAVASTRPQDARTTSAPGSPRRRRNTRRNRALRGPRTRTARRDPRLWPSVGRPMVDRCVKSTPVIASTDGERGSLSPAGGGVIAPPLRPPLAANARSPGREMRGLTPRCVVPCCALNGAA